MLSTKIVGNVNQAKHYFLGHDDYYTKENESAKTRSAWWGKNGDELGLAGQVDATLFTELLKGKLPSGQQLGIKVDGEFKHRAGFDLTFSAPKSVSILALIGEDTRIFEALSKATDKALAMIERACAQARITQNGVTTYQNTNNLVVAKFIHDLSREADPQLHVHCVVMNMSKCADGKWRSLASQRGDYGKEVDGEINGFIERVRHHKAYFGAIFRAELAYELKTLGYDIIKTGHQGLFEIQGISERSLKAFSKRSQQIESYMQDYGLSGAKAAAVATIKTRKTKDNINRENLQTLWHIQAEKHYPDAFTEARGVVEKALTPEKRQQEAINLQEHVNAKEAIIQAIAHLSETQIVLKDIEILNVACRYSIGENININGLLQSIQALQNEGQLIPLNADKSVQTFTTPTLIDYEKKIVSAIDQKFAGEKSISDTHTLTAFLLAQNELTESQKRAINNLFSSSHQITMLEGPSGSGKTTLIKPMMELAKFCGFRAVMLTPSKAASVDLQQQLRSAPQSLREWIKHLFDTNQYDTVTRFIKIQEQQLRYSFLPHPKTVIFVDNATQLASKQMHDLIKITQQVEARLIFIGDKKSTLSFQSGSPFIQLLNHGVHHACLTGNLKTQTAPIKAAVEDTLQGNMVNAFEKIQHRVLSITDHHERLETMASHYATLAPDIRKNAILLMPTKAQCEAVNQCVHEVLKQNNLLAAKGYTVTVLIPKSMRDMEYHYVINYRKGEWVRFNQAYLSLGIAKGSYLKISHTDSKNNSVTLENDRGRKIAWNPKKLGGRSGSVEVFEEKPREICPGEVLIAKRNDYRQNMYQGESFNVFAIKKDLLILERQNGKQLTLDLKQASCRHFDYAYAATAYQKQHVQFDVVIAYQNSLSRQTHQRSFYKLLSQAKKAAWIYTENREQLFVNLQKYTGDKTTAIDTLLHANQIAVDPKAMTRSEHILLIEQAIIHLLKKFPHRKLVSDTPEKIATDAVAYALAHLSEREAAFQHKDVLTVALKQVFGDMAIETLEKAIKIAEKNGDLIRGVYSQEGTKWTTKEAIALEKEILQLATQDKAKLSPLASLEVVENYLSQEKPKADIAQAVREISVGTDRVVLVQGFAGTGKTTMLMGVHAVAIHQGFHLLCLAPTHTAVKELKARGLAAQTLESFLLEHRGTLQDSKTSNPLTKTLIAVDEASMVSNRRFRDYLKLIHHVDCRTVIVGDTEQYAAIESGKPFALLQKAGVKTIYLTDIIRQKNPELLKAVKEVYQKDYVASFKTLEKNIIEIGREKVGDKTIDNRDSRLEAICEDYLARSVSMRAQTLIVTLGNNERVLINSLIRDGLTAEGELYGEKAVVDILTARDMTQIEKTKAMNYVIGDKLRFSQFDNTLNIEKGEYLTIRDKRLEDNALCLEKMDGQTVFYRLPKAEAGAPSIEPYQIEPREVMAGDTIRWTRSDKQLGLLSPELAKVVAIKDNQLYFQQAKVTQQGIVAEGDVLTGDLTSSKYQHWDHAYAITGYSAQAKTIKSVIICAESFYKNLANQPSMLVAISRAVDDLTLYTDDKKELLEKIQKNTGKKQSALEVMGEALFDTTSQLKTSQSSVKSRSIQEQVNNTFTGEAPLKKSTLDVARITVMLHENAEFVLDSVLGEPKDKSGGQYRYGSRKGSLVVTVSGDKRGLWHDFQTGEGGNLLQLIAKEARLDIKKDFKSVLECAVKIMGGSENLFTKESHSKSSSENGSRSKNTTQELTATQKKTLTYARKLARASQPITGTVAERYLQAHRKIELSTYPDCLRFHPAVFSQKNNAIHPALLVIAKDNRGQVQAVQAIYLDKETAKKADVMVQKQTFGLLKGASAELTKTSDKNAPVYLAEGPETALSIYASVKAAKVKITLGKSNFKNINTASIAKDVVLCLDNDGTSPDSEKIVQMAADKFIKQGLNIWVAKPSEVGKDFNDILKEQGINAVKSYMENAIPYENYRNNDIPAKTLKTEVLDKNNFTEDLHSAASLANKIPKAIEKIPLTKTIEMHAIYLGSEIQKQENELTKSVENLTKNHELLTQQIKGKAYQESAKMYSDIQYSTHNQPHKMPAIDKSKDKEHEL